jgi:hypothetical protein
MAQKEGNLVFYISMDAGDAHRTETPKSAIKMDLFRGGRGGLQLFSLGERRGAFTDVVSVGEFHILEMKKQGLITRYSSPENTSFSLT